MGTFFAVTAPGLDQITADEIRQLGLAPEIEPGGVSFKSDDDGMYRANLYLRTASRVLARVGQFFYATTFSDLREKSGRLPWEKFILPGQPISIRVTCHKSKLIHSDAVAERIAGSIYDRLGIESPVTKKSADEAQDRIADKAEENIQLIIVRLVNDQVMVSMDSSGELLHRRGYRLALAKAPLRETLAAGVILASGWDARSPLIDPFCGSGTIPIEAAMLAAGIPPGINRNFAFMKWPGFSKTNWDTILAQVPEQREIDFPIIASDRDAGAVKIAYENAKRAGVEKNIDFHCQAVSSINPPEQKGWLITNPPYGVRVSAGRDLRNLYSQFGNVLKLNCQGWHVGILCSDPFLLGHTALKLDTTKSLINGGIGVRLGTGIVG
ncbi:MAG: class I SAM-dependent RNA methyltransferase [Chloroflexota bacterium]